MVVSLPNQRPTTPHANKVDDGPTEVAFKRIWISQVTEASDHPKKRFLDKVFGETPIAREQVRKLERSTRVGKVKVAQPIFFLLHR